MISYSRRDGTEQWFAFTHDQRGKPGDNRIAFAVSAREVVDEVAALLYYYAVFFEDPDGNKLEVCCID